MPLQKWFGSYVNDKPIALSDGKGDIPLATSLSSYF